MKAIAFHLDEIPFVDGPSSEALKGYARKFIDQWCAMAGLTPIWMDVTRTLRKTNRNVAWSWTEFAQEFSPDHHLVFLDPAGTTPIADFDHPADGVIYCIGADEDGFGDLDLSPYDTVRLPCDQRYGFTTAAIVAADYMLRGGG